ncbi:signal transduction histidine kinase [Thiovulum sp. ES]|nr:signal transduction histidine kinase [Thiovulum sp. ES]
MVNMKKGSLHSIIYNNYLGASLIPIFVIELALIILYFSINFFISEKNMETMLNEASQNIKEISTRETTNINNQLREISRSAHFLQNEHQLFFTNPEAFGMPNGKDIEFEFSDNGAYYKKTQVGASLYYGNTVVIGDKEKEKAYRSEAMDTSLKEIVENNPNIVSTYFNSHDVMNRLYPFIENVAYQYGPTIPMEDYNFYYEADAEHNPERDHKWTSAYLDPAGQGWLISCIVPIYNGDFLEGVTGLDVTIDKFVSNILNLKLPWNGSAFLISENGMILAMPEKVEKLFGLKELKEYEYEKAITTTVEKPEDYNILKNKNKNVAKELKNMLDQHISLNEIEIDGKKYLISQETIQETGWKFMMIIEEETLFEPIYHLKDLSDKIGYLAIGLMFVFYITFFVFLLKKSKSLAKRIASPIETLSRVTDSLGRNLDSLNLRDVGILELDKLNKNFNSMGSELETRTKELIDSQIREKMKEKEAEYAYSIGLFESASSYLHNIGNSLAGINGKILNMKKSLSTTSNYPRVFEAIETAHKNSIAGGEDRTLQNISKFKTILIDKLVPKLEENLDDISKAQDQIVLTIKHQQEQFTKSNGDNTKKYIMEFRVDELLRNIIKDFEPSFKKHDIEVIEDISAYLLISNQRHQFAHGIANVVKNAIEAVEMSVNDKNEIRFKAEKIADGVLVSISDNGIGVKSENKGNMFKSGFTTKDNGHGIGLHSFVNFLNANDGRIEFESAGIQQGTTFYITIKNTKAK